MVLDSGAIRVAEKTMLGRGSGQRAGNLPHAVDPIPIDKQDIPGPQQDVILFYLVIQDACLCPGNFKIRVPVQRPFPAGKFGKFIFKKRDGEKTFLMGDMLTQMLIDKDRHRDTLFLQNRSGWDAPGFYPV